MRRRFSAVLRESIRFLQSYANPKPANGHARGTRQSRSQSMPVRELCSGMTLGKSNRNRYSIGCRDHQCCRHINACFFRELRVDIREERIINVYQIWNAKSNNINRRI
jgi:hypothetical protein